MTETEKFKLKDILYGLIVPIIVAILIVIFPAVLRPVLDNAFPAATSPNSFITVIFTHGLAMMVVFIVPLILGLIWNKWAGGAAGFIMGTLYYVAFAGYNTAVYGTNPGYSSYYADPSFIGNYIVAGVLVGYIAGALSNKSYAFLRMFGAGLTAAITIGVMQFILNYTVSGARAMTQGDPLYALFLTMLPMIIIGVVGPIFAKVFTWYGIQPGGHY
jgi:hypothetical protein